MAPSSRATASFALASASLRQALQDMPELTEISKHIMIEETKNGLNIEIVDQNGRSMFPEGSKEPYERTRRLIQRLAGAAQGDAVPHLDHRPYVGEPAAAAGRLRRRGSCPPTAPMRCASMLEAEGVPTVAFLHGGRTRPTPSRCSPTIPTSRPIAA